MFLRFALPLMFVFLLIALLSTDIVAILRRRVELPAPCPVGSA